MSYSFLLSTALLVRPNMICFSAFAHYSWVPSRNEEIAHFCEKFSNFFLLMMRLTRRVKKLKQKMMTTKSNRLL